MASKHPVIAYMAGVLDGSVPACKAIRQAVERHQRDLVEGPKRGLHFDRAAADFVIKFFSFLQHSKGEWAGQPFKLEPWQMFLVWVLFGWKRADGLRRFRTAYIEVPRKNGKTTLMAGLGLFLLTADGEPGSEVYSAATKRDQAKLLWSEAVRMVRASPALSNMVQHWKSSDNLSVEATASRFMPLGADADTMDGLNIHAGLIDELHAHRTRAVVDVLHTATGARQPLIVEITTAGFDQESICYGTTTTRSRCWRNDQDDTWFAFIAGRTRRRLDGSATWAKANPNLGVSVKLNDLAQVRAGARCRHSRTLRVHLDQWTQQSDRWIDLALWDANGSA